MLWVLEAYRVVPSLARYRLSLNLVFNVFVGSAWGCRVGIWNVQVDEQ